MKQRSGPLKTVSNLSESVHQQLSMYALTAVLATVGVLALTRSSAAKIVYTPTNVQISRRYDLDLNHDGITDVAFFVIDKVSTCPPNQDRSLWEEPVLRNGSEADTLGALALAEGARIGKGGSFQGRVALMVSSTWIRSFICMKIDAGHWQDVSNGYLGLQLKIHGKTHYGWARLSVQPNFSSINATLTGYAYETIPGKSLKAGQRKEAADDPTNEDLGSGAFLTDPIPDAPQPASLGVLALGAQGVLWRRKESALEGELKRASL